jgi:hypothetical protein
MPQSTVPRNVYVYDSSQADSPVLVAGFFQFGQTTGEEFYFNLELYFVQPQRSTFRLLSANGLVLPRDGTIVGTGVYYVISLCTNLLVFHANGSGPCPTGPRYLDKRSCAPAECIGR